MSGLFVLPLCVGLFGGPADAPDAPSPGSPVLAYRSAMYMFVVLGSEHPIVVDTGTGTPEQARARQNRVLWRPPEFEPLEALHRAGVDPAEVRIVVNTHLHWDHSGGNDLFPAARVLVQRREVAAAVDPPHHHRPFYDKLPGVTPDWLNSWDRIDAVDGDADLGGGVRLVALPGHTDGSQGVLVDTASGRQLIAGDTVNTFADWRDRRPPALIDDPGAWRSSAARIEELDATVIPSHDLALLRHGPFGLDREDSTPTMPPTSTPEESL